MIKRLLRTLWEKGKKYDTCIAHCVERFCPESQKRYCNICGHQTVFFRNAGINSVTLKELEVIGGSKRTHTVCPYCGSIDRFRYSWYVLSQYAGINDSSPYLGGYKILHFAPESCIAQILEEKFSDDYYTADIVPGRAKYCVDITNIQFESNSYNLTIANHVLEHIKNEHAAVKELIRVTRNDGIIVLSAPISLKLKKTIEETSELSDQERLKRFGQIDHVRLYGDDFKTRLESYGLKVDELAAMDILSENDIRRMKLIENDKIFICRK